MANKDYGNPFKSGAGASCSVYKSSTRGPCHSNNGIFPGWYASRTTHVHFIVTASGHSSVTSQLFFDEAISTAVYTWHGSYSARGNKDTSNAGDNVARGLTLSEVTLTVTQQSDGVLVAAKTLTIA